MRIRLLLLPLLTLLALLVPPATAQTTDPPTSYTLRIYVTGQPAALSTATIQATAVACNQAAPAPTVPPALNPTRWIWDDPVTAGRVCIYSDATRFNGLADGSYEGTAQALNAAGSSAETARIPFTRRRPTLPGVPTNPRIIP